MTQWIYESDTVLSHVSGLKIEFDWDESCWLIPHARSHCAGDFVPGTVDVLHSFLRSNGRAGQIAFSALALYKEAAWIFRNRPPGSPGAPRRKES